MSDIDISPSSSGTTFRVEWQGPATAVLTATGELDLHSAAAMRRELFRAIADGARVVVVDMESTPFVDSTSLSVMLGAVRRLHETGGELRIACADPNIRRIFEITLLDRVFAVFPSRTAALGRSVAPP